MINPNKFTIEYLPISYHMNLKYSYNLWKLLELLLTLQKKIENENFAIKQTQFHEIKWFYAF
jgi:hypothetical protein